MRLRFTSRTFFLFVTAACVLIALGVGRANRQRKAIATIEKNGGVVFFKGEPVLGFEEMISHPHGLIRSMLSTVTGVQISFYEYNDETKSAMADLPSLETICVVGHDADFGAIKIQDDFPNVRIDNPYDMIWSCFH